jgi:hypothetical protein
MGRRDGSYLSDRKQCVRSDGEYSTARGNKYGVPQGTWPTFVYFIY